MSSSVQIEEAVTTQIDLRSRKDATKPMLGNQQTSCPHCGRTGKRRRIEEHIPDCPKRPR